MNLLQGLPNPQRRAIDVIREVSAEKDCHPFLVGGPVRDLILGRTSIDVDLALEEGGSTLARALAKRMEGRVRSFPQFLTYKVVAEGFPELDIATTRKERYRQPGALPAVTAGRLKDDLLRRDFSINALALDLVDGTMHDPTGGEADIRAGRLRVLHDRSFIDDPTRIFRAVRLATRLGFTIEAQTADLMKAAIGSDALGTVSRERVWRELFLAMDEDEAPAILSALCEQGALRVLFGPRAHRDVPAKLESVRGRLVAETDLDRHVVYTGLLLRGDASPIDFEGSGFSQKRAKAVVEIANDIPRVEELLASAKDDRKRFSIYRDVSSEMLAVIESEHPEEIPLVARFHEFEDFKLPLRGNDLEVPGGPHVAKALEQTREAVFNGQIALEDARSYAREVAKRLFEESAPAEVSVTPNGVSS